MFFAVVFVASFCFILEQDSLDEARQKIFNIREEYRNKLLEAERLKLEAQAAEEAASRVEPEKKVPAPDTHKKKKEKKKWPGRAQHHLSSGEEKPIFHYL